MKVLELKIYIKLNWNKESRPLKIEIDIIRLNVYYNSWRTSYSKKKIIQTNKITN
jgi:hypothetical protein